MLEEPGNATNATLPLVYIGSSLLFLLSTLRSLLPGVYIAFYSPLLGVYIAVFSSLLAAMILDSSFAHW